MLVPARRRGARSAPRAHARRGDDPQRRLPRPLRRAADEGGRARDARRALPGGTGARSRRGPADGQRGRQGRHGAHPRRRALRRRRRPDGQRPRRRQGHRGGARRPRGRPGGAAAAGRGRRRPGPGRPGQELDLRHRGDGRPHARLPPTPTGGAARRRGPLDAAVDAASRADRENIAPWTGPYVPTQDGPDGQVVLVRNPDFRPLPDDWRRAYAERIRLEVDDSPGAASRVLNGERLVLGSTTVPASVATAATHRKQLTRVVMPATEYVGLNPTMPPFDRLDVRKAAIAAVDRQALLDAVRENGGILASHWLPPGTPGHDQAGGAEGPRYDWLARPEGDLAVATAYLRRAGFADGSYEGRPIVAFTAGRPPVDGRRAGRAPPARAHRHGPPAARGARRGRARRVLGPRLGRGDLPRGRAVEPGPRPRGAAAPRLRRGAGLEPDGDRRPRRGHDARERHPARRAAGAGVGRHRTRRGRDRPGRALALGRAAAARVPRRARGRRRRLGRVGPRGDVPGARARRAARCRRRHRRLRRPRTGRTAARERSRSRDRRPRRSPATRRCRPARAG